MIKILMLYGLFLPIVSCNEAPIKGVELDENKIIIENNATPILDNYKDFLILNGLSENYSIVRHENDDLKSEKNIHMSPDPNGDESPCMAGSEILNFNDLLYVVCSLSNEIQVIEKKQLRLVDRISIGNSSNPMSMKFISNDLAVVSGFISDEIIFLNPSIEFKGEKIIKRIDLRKLSLEQDVSETRPKPTGMLIKGNKVLITLSNLDEKFTAGGSGYLLVIEQESLEIANLIKLKGKNSVNVYNNPMVDNQVYVLNAGSYHTGENGGYVGDGSIDIVDTDSWEVLQSVSIAGAPYEMIFAPDHITYLTNGKEGVIFEFDTKKNEVRDIIDLKKNPCNDLSNLSLSYISSAVVDSKFLYVTEFNSNCFIKIDRNSKEITDYQKTGSGPQAILVIK